MGDAATHARDQHDELAELLEYDGATFLEALHKRVSEVGSALAITHEQSGRSVTFSELDSRMASPIATTRSTKHIGSHFRRATGDRIRVRGANVSSVHVEDLLARIMRSMCARRSRCRVSVQTGTTSSS